MKSISNQVFASIILSSSLIFGGWLYYRIQRIVAYETKKDYEIHVRNAEQIANYLSYPMEIQNKSVIDDNLQNEVSDKYINSVKVFDATGRLYASAFDNTKDLYSKSTKEKELREQDSIVRTIFYQKKNIGKVILYFNNEPLKTFINNLKINLFEEFLVLVLLITLIQFLILKRVLINPLLSLKNWVKTMDIDNKFAPSDLFSNKEIGTITDSVTQLTDHLISSLKENSKNSKKISDKESIITAINTNLPEGMIYRIITKGTDYRKFVYLGGSFQKMYGHSPEEGIADPTLMFRSVFKGDVQPFFDAEVESIKTLSTFNREVRMINPDGTIRVSRFVSTPTVMEDGSICWDGIELDITDIKKTEADLQYSQFLLKSITEGLPDRIFAKDLNGNFLFANSAVAKLINKNPEDILGKNDSNIIFSPEEANRTMKKDLEIMQSEEVQTFEEQFIISDKTVTFLTTKGPLKDAQGKIIGLFGIARNITDIKKTKAELQQNQFLLKSITEGLPDRIFAKDLNGNFLFANSAVSKLINKNPEDILGKNDSSIIFSPEEANRTMKKDFEIMQSGEVQTFQEQFIISDKTITTLTTKGPLKDAQGKIVGVYGIARDITELREREEALRFSQEKFEFAFNSSPNAILIQDKQSARYMEVNASITNIFGYSQDEVLTKTPLELNFYKDPTFREKIYETLEEQGYVRNMEVVCRHKSGEDLHVLLTLEPHYVDDKPILYVNIQDVTERKQVEFELQRLNLDKDRFISILGHDLRGPVNGIVGILELLQSNDLSAEEIKEMNDLVYQSAKKTSDLLDDVLLWATAKSGKMRFKPKIINFKADCLGIVELYQFSATSKNIVIETHCEDCFEVYADRNMLGTVLRNLISNALKFTNDGGRIIVSAEKTPENTIISIADNGVGIAAKHIKKIFDKAQLFTSIGTNEEKGTGFGLKLCQEFVEKHGGKIWVESEEGKGTTFNFSLPMPMLHENNLSKKKHQNI